MKRKTIILILSTLLLLSYACAPITSVRVELSRDRYQPRLETSKYAEYKGQTMIFDSVDIEAPNVENFYYLSDNKQVGYTLFYSPVHMQQPVVSFFWYALEKTFTHVGIDVKEKGTIKNIPQLHLKIKYLTDSEAKFLVSLSRNGYLIMQKEIVASIPPTPITVVSELEQRSYIFIDSMAEAILNDPDFKREFFSDKGKIGLDKPTIGVPQISPPPVPPPASKEPSIPLAPVTPSMKTEQQDKAPPVVTKPVTPTVRTEEQGKAIPVETKPVAPPVVREQQSNALPVVTKPAIPPVEKVKQDKAIPVTKPTPPPVQGDPRYRDIKGIVLKNGIVMEGQILSEDYTTVKFRNNNGEVSYYFKKEIDRFIKE